MAATQVAFTDLDTYLKSLDNNTIDTPYELDITGLDNTTLKGALSMSDATEGTLQYVLNQNSKKYISLNESAGSVTATDITYAFAWCDNIISVAGDFSSVVTAVQTFFNCSNLTSADLSNFTSLQDATSMFRVCTKLTSIDISSLYQTLTNADNMFYFCIKLANVNLGTNAFEKLTHANYMFYRCEVLSSLDVKALTNIVYAMNFVSGCYKLKEITNWNFDINKLLSFANFFENCPADLVIKFPYKTYNTFSLVRVRTNSSGNVTIKKQKVNSSASTETTLTTELGNKIKFLGAIDEIAVASEITDDQFNNMFTNRYKWNSSDSIVEVADNLILWAKDEEKITSNFLNTTLSMQDKDFDSIFTGGNE